MTTTTDSLLP